MRSFIATLLITLFLPVVALAKDERACIERRSPFVDDSTLDLLLLLRDIKLELTLSRNIAVVSCQFFTEDAKAFMVIGENATDQVPAGEYIIYDPKWVREVIGSDQAEAIFVLGHEVGHFVENHFIFPELTPPRKKELDADAFGACATARLGERWEAVDQVLKEIRPEFGESHPSYVESIAVAKAAFERCDGMADRFAATPPPTGPVPPADAVQAVSETMILCQGEHYSRCPQPSIHLGCQVSAEQWAGENCSNSTVSRVATFGGNECGYGVSQVICSK